MATVLVLEDIILLDMLSSAINKVIVMPVLMAILTHGDAKPNKGVTNLPTRSPMARGIIIFNIRDLFFILYNLPFNHCFG
jgi:hypothetical protein